jgi:putative membrane protein
MESELRIKMLLFIVSVLGTLAVLTAISMGQSTVPGGSGVPASPQAGLSDKSAAVLRTVASSNLFEIESSRLA